MQGSGASLSGSGVKVLGSGPGGGGGGMCHWGLYIMRVNHFLKSTLKRGWSDGTHSSLNTTPRVRTGVSLPDSYPFRGLSAGSVNLIPFFHIFLFSIPLTRGTRYARYEPGGEKDTLFTRFYWRGWYTGPNETCPPPPPPRGSGASSRSSAD